MRHNTASLACEQGGLGTQRVCHKVVDDVGGVVTDAEECPGLEGVHPMKSEEVQAGDLADATLLERLSGAVQAWCMDPVVSKE